MNDPRSSKAGRSPIPYLLATTLLELAALPWHIASFLVRRAAIRQAIRNALRPATEARSEPSRSRA